MLAVLLSITTSCGDGKKQDAESTEVEQSDPPREHPDTELVGDASTGKKLYRTCVACHGEDGRGIKSLNAPSLVNQEAWYLERQLKNFRSDIRGGDPEDTQGAQMAAMAKTLVDDQAVTNVVEYIKTLAPFPTEKTMEGDIQNGRDYYNMICGACHGPGAVGNQSLNSPALVGIDDWYLELQLHNFKNGLRGSHPDDEFGEQMKLISEAVPNDKLFKDAIAYIHSLQEENQ
ncbi:MAG: c-type cytochrome [Bacteroidetes bacterium]|nr:c-type cytochrome [Bacteroidota bacterium]